MSSSMPPMKSLIKAMQDMGEIFRWGRTIGDWESLAKASQRRADHLRAHPRNHALEAALKFVVVALLAAAVIVCIILLSTTSNARAQIINQNNIPAIFSPAQEHNCTHSHSRKVAMGRVTSLMYSPRSLTKGRRARAWHYVKCTRIQSSYQAVKKRLLKGRTWRKSYAGYWKIRAYSMGNIHSWLTSLRVCESGQRYAYNGRSGFDGAYQYLPSTWTKVQAMFTPYRYRVRYAYKASVAHQDVLTALYWPGHKGEWPNCP